MFSSISLVAVCARQLRGGGPGSVLPLAMSEVVGLEDCFRVPAAVTEGFEGLETGENRDS